MTSRKEPVPRAAPSDEIDTIAYAVSFLRAATKLSDLRWEDNHPLVIPFYMLIVFSIENGFKANLSSSGMQNVHWDGRTRMIWPCSGNCARIEWRFLTNRNRISREAFAGCIKYTHFRYPQKAGVVELD